MQNYTEIGLPYEALQLKKAYKSELAYKGCLHWQDMTPLQNIKTVS